MASSGLCYVQWWRQRMAGVLSDHWSGQHTMQVRALTSPCYARDRTDLVIFLSSAARGYEGRHHQHERARHRGQHRDGAPQPRQQHRRSQGDDQRRANPHPGRQERRQRQDAGDDQRLTRWTGPSAAWRPTRTDPWPVGVTVTVNHGRGPRKYSLASRIFPAMVRFSRVSRQELERQTR